MVYLHCMNATIENKITTQEITTFLVSSPWIKKNMLEKYTRVMSLRLEGKTLQAIAMDIGKTRERVRQMEGKCCEIIRISRTVDNSK